MEEKKNLQQRVCPKDCRRCGMAQQIYCATSLTFNSYEVMSKLWERMDSIERKIDAIQSAEGEFMKPLGIKEEIPFENDMHKGVCGADE